MIQESAVLLDHAERNRVPQQLGAVMENQEVKWERYPGVATHPVVGCASLFCLTPVVSCEPAVLTIGFFDGVHRGHQHVIRHVIERASQYRARAVLVTFWPHPQHVLHSERPKPLLTTLQEKLELLATLGGLDTAVVMPFTRELARLTPREYLEVLRTHFQLRALIVGADFALGHHRAGDISWLQQAGKQGGFTVEALTLAAGNRRISSTHIRELIAVGHLEEAADLLGRPYTVVGPVSPGDSHYHKLGFPPANVLLDPMKVVPANGVYAVRVQLPGDERASRPAVAYIGRRPNSGEANPALVKVHLLDGQADLSSRQLRIEFIAWLREEWHFHSTQALHTQMRTDADRTRALVVRPPPGTSSLQTSS
jgi:riboflavin kinase/FMN adenylyltransferase